MVELPYSKEIIEHFKHPKNLGKIKNPDAVGEAGNLLCVLPNTLIYTKDGLIPIQSIRKNTLVLSHEGKYYPVKALYKRYYEGKVILIENRLGKNFVTPDHLVLAKKISTYYPTWHHAAELKEGDITFSIPKEENNSYIPITKIMEKKYRGLVYNLEVEKVHSFATNCFVLHNCGDVMRIYLKIKERNGKRIISNIKGEVFGCVVAVANTSMLTLMVKGKSLEEAMKIEKDELIEKLGGKEKIPPIKIHCSILALDALKEAIYNYYQQNNLPIPKKLEDEHQRIQKTIQEIEKRHKEFLELERKLLK